MKTTIGCPIPGESQPKEPMRPQMSEWISVKDRLPLPNPTRR